MTELKLGSLFDGIGGFPLAATMNDIRPVWASEIDPFPMAVTAYRFPEMKHMGDITKLHGANLPVVDVIAGGSPCQDLSVAGKREGLAGERSGLFMEQVRIVKEMRKQDGRSLNFMQYIWEVVLAAEKNGIREADLRYEVAEVRSPYLEVSFYDLNTQTVEQTAVEVNPFYRFFDIFSGVLDINQKEYEKTKEIFVDAVFHYLALTDLRMGMSRKDYYFKFLVEELESGQFGRKAKAAIQLFSSYEKKYIVLALMDVVSSRNYREIFKWLFQEIYQDSIIYKSMDCANELYIYVGSAETQEERKRVQFLLDTFLPIGVRTEIFYLEHFGILEIEETMILDKVLLI